MIAALTPCRRQNRVIYNSQCAIMSIDKMMRRRLNWASVVVKGRRDDPASLRRIDTNLTKRIAALNSAAIRLPNRVLGTKIRLPIGSPKYIQLIEVKSVLRCWTGDF